MSRNRSILVIKAVSLTALYLALFIPATSLCDTYDDDTTLEFHWAAASGDVVHYNVYLSIDGGNYVLIEPTVASPAPTEKTPYALPIAAEDGRKYQLKVEAEDTDGLTGPMSEPSDPVWCKLRSPGDANGATAGDIDGDSRVGVKDWSIVCKAWNTQRGDPNFDYRADLNYDDSVNLLDIVIVSSNWGNSYTGGADPS